MIELDELQSEIGHWQANTFKNQTTKGLINHLREEVEEFSEEYDPEEAADCLILLLGIAHRRGFRLLYEANLKFKIIQKREWHEPDERGVINHKKETT